MDLYGTNSLDTAASVWFLRKHILGQEPSNIKYKSDDEVSSADDLRVLLETSDGTSYFSGLLNTFGILETEPVPIVSETQRERYDVLRRQVECAYDIQEKGNTEKVCPLLEIWQNLQIFKDTQAELERLLDGWVDGIFISLFPQDFPICTLN